MKTICFTHEYSMLMYVFTSPINFEFKTDLINNELSGFYSKDITVVFCNDDYLKNRYHTIKNIVDVFVGWTEINTSFNQDSINKVRKFLDDKTKFIIFDDIGEYSFEFNRDDIYDFVDSNPNNYFITQRYTNIKPHKRILNNQIYLPLFHYYFNINEFLYIHPNLPNFDFSRVRTPKYDFMCYLGKEDWVADDKPWRAKIINKIDFKDKTFWKPSTFHTLTEKNKLMNTYVENKYDLRFTDYGEYLVTGLLETMDAKVKLTFESFQILDEEVDVGYDSFDEDQQFLTEKTLKCFLFTHPYILFLNKGQHTLLEKIGFKLPFPSYQDNLIDFINNLMNEDNLDDWILKSMDSFKHNQTHLQFLLSDKNLPLTKFLQKIL